MAKKRKWFKVNVTQWDIDNGVREACGRCPIALALLRDFPGVSVGTRICLFDSPTTLHNKLMGGIASLWGCDTPLLADAFISEFDSGYSVKPFSFKLDITDV